MNLDTPTTADQQHFKERFETLIPTIQREWPEVARQTLEATRGSLDEVAEVIAEHSGKTVSVVRDQLQELLHVAGERPLLALGLAGGVGLLLGLMLASGRRSG